MYKTKQCNRPIHLQLHVYSYNISELKQTFKNSDVVHTLVVPVKSRDKLGATLVIFPKAKRVYIRFNKKKFLCATFLPALIYICMKYVQAHFKRKMYVHSKFSCARSSHDLCARLLAHSLKETLTLILW